MSYSFVGCEVGRIAELMRERRASRQKKREVPGAFPVQTPMPSVPLPDRNGHGKGPYDKNDLNDQRPRPTKSRAGQLDGGEGVYRLVTTDADLGTVLATIGESILVALDTETTGLTPRTDRVRLLSIATDKDDVVHLIDCSAISPAPLWDVLREKTIVGHNLAFDLIFLRGIGFEPGHVADTMLLSQLLHGTRKGKGFHGLAATVKRELGGNLNKAEQRSDWTGTLTDEQLQYAALDAAVLLPLYEALQVMIRETKQEQVASIEARCLPAMAWLASSGIPFDKVAWDALAVEAKRRAEALTDRLDEEAPTRPGHLSRQGAWDWNSQAQVKEAFALVGVTLEKTDDDALAGVAHPLAALVRDYRSASKMASTYGSGWTKEAYHEGRLYAGWRQLGCVTGRMSSSSPNMQNLPGDPRYRACFRAPEGRVLVKADYSQIELRIAARIANDKAMLDAYVRREDLHTLTAARMTGKPLGEVTAAERKLAKPVNFGLIYGLGVNSLRQKAKADYGLDLGEDEARRYKAAFFAAYRSIDAWHRQIKREQATETRTLAGRRAVVEADGFYGGKANYMVQGTGGDGVKLALAILWERRTECVGTFPVLVVHDEIVVECDAGQADAVKAWLKKAMIDAMASLIDPVPVEVEVKVGRTWAGG
jgi:DNA polymerase-1